MSKCIAYVAYDGNGAICQSGVMDEMDWPPKLKNPSAILLQISHELHLLVQAGQLSRHRVQNGQVVEKTRLQLFPASASLRTINQGEDNVYVVKQGDTITIPGAEKAKLWTNTAPVARGENSFIASTPGRFTIHVRDHQHHAEMLKFLVLTEEQYNAN